MTLKEAAETIGLTWEDIRHEDANKVIEMFADVGITTTWVYDDGKILPVRWCDDEP